MGGSPKWWLAQDDTMLATGVAIAEQIAGMRKS